MVASSSYSYSEIINGTTPNAAGNGLSWAMPNILPQESGLVVNAVIYRYTAIKNTQDDMIVTVQNKDALGNGLVFQSTDNWSQLPGNNINKLVPVDTIPLNRWGDGSIDVQGQGSVVDPTVVYVYRYDTCADPIKDPRCPGYEAAMAAFLKAQGIDLSGTTKVDDAYNSQEVQDALNKKTEVKEEELASAKEKEEKDKKEQERKKNAVKAAENALAQSQEISQAALLEAMNSVPKFEAYYASNIPGGAYADAVRYEPKTVPENRRAMRVGLAQQILHDKMIEQQYNSRRP